MSANRNNGGADALAEARKLTGLEYIFGGTYPENDGTDCSGLVQWAYRQVGVELPRTTYEQFTVSQIPNDEPLAVGDLLFIAGSDGTPENPGHVMMYVAPGEVFEAEETGTRIGQFPYDTAVYNFRTRPALALPEPPPPAPAPPLPPAVGHPRAADIAKAGLVPMTDVGLAETALHNGWTLWYWSKTHFCPQVNGEPKPEALYANKAYATKKPA